jgi:hypothetical protein
VTFNMQPECNRGVRCSPVVGRNPAHDLILASVCREKIAQVWEQSIHAPPATISHTFEIILAKASAANTARSMLQVAKTYRNHPERGANKNLSWRTNNQSLTLTAKLKQTKRSKTSCAFIMSLPAAQPPNERYATAAGSKAGAWRPRPNFCSAMRGVGQRRFVIIDLLAIVTDEPRGRQLRPSGFPVFSKCKRHHARP